MNHKTEDKLKQFQILPDEALVSINVVCALRDRSRASIWRDVKAGLCPPPIRIGARCTRWRVGDLRVAAKLLTERLGSIESNIKSKTSFNSTEAFYG